MPEISETNYPDFVYVTSASAADVTLAAEEISRIIHERPLISTAVVLRPDCEASPELERHAGSHPIIEPSPHPVSDWVIEDIKANYGRNFSLMAEFCRSLGPVGLSFLCGFSKTLPPHLDDMTSIRNSFGEHACHTVPQAPEHSLAVTMAERYGTQVIETDPANFKEKLDDYVGVFWRWQKHDIEPEQVWDVPDYAFAVMRSRSWAIKQDGLFYPALHRSPDRPHRKAAIGGVLGLR